MNIYAYKSIPILTWKSPPPEHNSPVVVPIWPLLVPENDWYHWTIFGILKEYGILILSWGIIIIDQNPRWPPRLI